MLSGMYCVCAFTNLHNPTMDRGKCVCVCVCVCLCACLCLCACVRLCVGGCGCGWVYTREMCFCGLTSCNGNTAVKDLLSTKRSTPGGEGRGEGEGGRGEGRRANSAPSRMSTDHRNLPTTSNPTHSSTSLCQPLPTPLIAPPPSASHFQPHS